MVSSAPSPSPSQCQNVAERDRFQHQENSRDGSSPTDRKRMFLQLLRQGIYDQITRQHPRDQHHNFDNHVPNWHSLWWRNVWAGDRFFCEQIDGHTMRIQQLRKGELTGLGTGASVWPAACVLIKCLEFHFGLQGSFGAQEKSSELVENLSLKNQRVLELGSGTGAVGIAAALLGAKSVLVTDIAKLVPLMQSNVDCCRQNHPQVNDLQVCEYEWGTPPPEEWLRDGLDLILVSDCILPRLYPMEPLVEALTLLTSCSSTRIWISYEQRYFPEFDPKRRFWSLVRARGFVLRALALAEQHPHYRAPDIEIWEITRSDGS